MSPGPNQTLLQASSGAWEPSGGRGSCTNPEVTCPWPQHHLLEFGLHDTHMCSRLRGPGLGILSLATLSTSREGIRSLDERSVLPTCTSSFMRQRHALLKHSSVVSPHGAFFLNLQELFLALKMERPLCLPQSSLQPSPQSPCLPSSIFLWGQTASVPLFLACPRSLAARSGKITTWPLRSSLLLALSN